MLQDQSGESPFSQDQATLPTCPTDRSGIASLGLVGEEQLEQLATPIQTHQRNNFFNDSFWAPIRLQLLRDSGRLCCSRLLEVRWCQKTVRSRPRIRIEVNNHREICADSSCSCGILRKIPGLVWSAMSKKWVWFLKVFCGTTLDVLSVKINAFKHVLKTIFFLTYKSRFTQQQSIKITSIRKLHHRVFN